MFVVTYVPYTVAYPRRLTFLRGILDRRKGAWEGRGKHSGALLVQVSIPFVPCALCEALKYALSSQRPQKRLGLRQCYKQERKDYLC